MRVLPPAALVLALAWALPAAAENLPQFPKIAPPQPLPEAACDTTIANNGEWLLGRWVAPHTKWSFARDGKALTWALDRKGSIGEQFGWQEGTAITGTVTAVTGCTVQLSAGQGAFTFDGVLTEGGKLYGYAMNTKGDAVRFILRRER